MGFALNGVLHFLVGTVAIAVAVGLATSDQADPAGALRKIASSPGGVVVVWAAAASFAALGLWQITRAGDVRAPTPLRRWGRRFSETMKGLVYFPLALTALAIALGATPDSSQVILAISTLLLETPAGSITLAAVGLGIAGGGIGFIVIGIRRGFRKLIRVPTGRGGRLVLGVGLTGYVAKGLALVILGAVVVVAAATDDAQRATGLDGALRSLTQLPFGTLLLAVVGVGLVLYGLFLAIRARLALL